MHSARVILLCAIAVTACSALPWKAPKTENGGKNWVLLMAGSNTWGNYRHQADIYHAYQIVKKGGVPDENIVVMHYDDIANSPQNPKKGTVINSPTGSDVYAGVPKDYTGADVNAKNFLAALLGKAPNASAPEGACDKKGKFVCPAATSCCCTKKFLFECTEYACCKSGQTCDSHKHSCEAPPPPPAAKKSIDSGPNDNVFVYYADHGGPGILGVPGGAGDYLHAKDIVDTLKQKAANNGFKQLTFYLEACESGSIFDGLLPDNINVYATTAANPSESSWGTYCPGMKPSPPSGYDTCLGDLYSVAWLENADASDLKTETLAAQFKYVHDRTSQNGTYAQGSHVMQYGDTNFTSEDCAEFEGESPADTNALPAPSNAVVGAVNSRQARLLHLKAKSERTQSKADLDAYAKELEFMQKIDMAVADMASAIAGSKQEAEKLMSEVHTPVVQDWNCFKGAIRAFQESCMPMREYGMRHARTLANLCDAGFTPEHIGKAADKACH